MATVNPPALVIGVGLHVINIIRYVITIKKHLHDRIETERQ